MPLTSWPRIEEQRERGPDDKADEEDRKQAPRHRPPKADAMLIRLHTPDCRWHPAPAASRMAPERCLGIGEGFTLNVRREASRPQSLLETGQSTYRRDRSKSRIATILVVCCRPCAAQCLFRSSERCSVPSRSRCLAARLLAQHLLSLLQR